MLQRLIDKFVNRDAEPEYLSGRDPAPERTEPGRIELRVTIVKCSNGSRLCQVEQEDEDGQIRMVKLHASYFEFTDQRDMDLFSTVPMYYASVPTFEPASRGRFGFKLDYVGSEF